MPIWNLTKEAKFVRLNNSVAAGTTTVTTSIFNLQGQASAGIYPVGTTSTLPAGFDAITVIIALNTVLTTAVLQINIQDNSLNQTSGMANVAASLAQGILGITNVAVTQQGTNAGLVVTDTGGASSNGLILLDVALVQQQFYQVVVARTVANSALDGIFGILYRSKERPVIHDTTVVGQGYFVASS
jgi:hypothetical protein